MSLLEVTDLHVEYGPVAAVRGVSISADAGEIVSLIGANGAGKTSILRAISRLVPAASGRIVFDGQDITGTAPERLAGLGLAHCPEGRQVLAGLSVADNLALGAYARRDRQAVAGDLRSMFELFPRLRERKNQRAGTLSGGEQQMLALARALMSRPRLLLLDEPSLGLAPLITAEIFKVIAGLTGSGTAVVLVEQNARLAMRLSRRTYVVQSGEIVLSGDSATVAGDERVAQSYLG